MKPRESQSHYDVLNRRMRINCIFIVMSAALWLTGLVVQLASHGALTPNRLSAAVILFWFLPFMAATFIRSTFCRSLVATNGLPLFLVIILCHIGVLLFLLIEDTLRGRWTYPGLISNAGLMLAKSIYVGITAMHIDQWRAVLKKEASLVPRPMLNQEDRLWRPAGTGGPSFGGADDDGD